MAIRIEIDKSYKQGTWKLRIGDLTGSTEDLNITMDDVLKFIKDAMTSYDKRRN